MRARYTAFAREDRQFLLASWHPATRPASLSAGEEALTVKWIGLKIVSVEDGGETDSSGIVEFIARYKFRAGPTGCMSAVASAR